MLLLDWQLINVDYLVIESDTLLHVRGWYVRGMQFNLKYIPHVFHFTIFFVFLFPM